MSSCTSTSKKTYAQVAASPPQSDESNGSETVNSSKSDTQSGSTDSSVGSEPELVHQSSLESSKSAEDGKCVSGHGPKVPVDNASEEFIQRKNTSMLTDKENGGTNRKDEQSEDDELEVLSEEIEKKRNCRRKTAVIVSGVIVGLAVIGVIWWTVRRRSTSG